MLLKSLKVVNFRQFFGEQTIEFATDETRNVTVIMGENGSGKTTLAQAFTWCLYGDTDFEDKVVLNRALERKMLPGQEAKVRVELKLIHNGTEYTIIAEQIYRKDTSGRAKGQNIVRTVAYKKNGQQEFVRPLEVDSYIKQILPKELSRYFFFDGERIGKMSKEIRKGKSQEFAQAVRGLLGLNAFIAALEHLNPRSKYGVIGSYNQSYDVESDKRIAQYNQEIERIQDRLNRIDERLTELVEQIEIARDLSERTKEKLKEYEETAKLQEEKQKLEKELNKSINDRHIIISEVMQEFHKHYATYFSKSLILKSLEYLSEDDKLDKGIPDIHARTIEFLINRGSCVCGTEIKEGNEAYKKLIEALKYLPPQSIGIAVNQFVRESEIKVKSSTNLYEYVSEKYRIFRQHQEEENRLLSDIQSIEKKIEGMEGIGILQSNLSRYEKNIRDYEREKDELNKEKGALETKRDRLEYERQELTLRDEKNKKIEIYKKYAEYIFDELSRVYKENEDETRKKLEQYINEIFKNIYEGGLSISVDEKYNIQVFVDDESNFNNDIETSTAQSISVIFAFISGIIKMAREISKERDNDNKLLDSEPYPLVMDAPLSAFDRRRIKTVCDVLPNIAEQVIIFIKDTDGELAEEYMGLKVGKRYLFNKIDELHTILTPR